MTHYSEGQVWEYRARRAEESSLLKIQKIETDPESGELIFHISLTGLKWRHFGDTLAHAPVSRATLDMSVTRLSADHGQFPDANEGIAIWKEADGGVYDMSVAEIVELGDHNL